MELVGASIYVDCFRLAFDNGLSTLIAHRITLQALLWLLISFSIPIVFDDVVDSWGLEDSRLAKDDLAL